MKTIANLWWAFLIVTLISYSFLQDCMKDIQTLVDQNTGWHGFLVGFLHGFIFDFDYIRRVSEQANELVSRAILWQNVYRLSLLATIIAGGMKIHFITRPKSAANFDLKK